jgi:CRP-like cAMP-binding protein
MRTRSRAAGAQAARLASHLWEGLRAIITAPGPLAVCGFVSLTSLLYGMQTVLLVLLADKQLGAGAEGYGYLLAGLGVGGAAAGLVAGYLAGLPRPGVLLTAAVVIMGLSIAALALTHGLATALPLLAVQGVTNIVTDVTAFTLLQRALPEDLLARIFGFVRLAIIASTLLGALIAPPLLQAVGLDRALVIPGLAAGVLAMLATPLTRRLTLAALRTFEETRARFESLSRLSILKGVPRPALELLAREGEEVEARQRAVIVRQGDAADALYLIELGFVDVAAGKAGAEQHLARLGAGDYFGEIGILRGVPRTATVTAATPVLLYRIDAEDFLDAVNGAPVLSGALAEGMAARLARGGSVRRARRSAEREAQRRGGPG